MRRRADLRFATLLAVELAVSAGGADAAAGKQYPCSWVHGRLASYNGNPTFRLWPTGSHRLLGVVCERHGCAEPPEVLPQKLLKFEPGFGRELWGDFRVCPLEPERKGWMRMVRLTDARNVTVIDWTRKK